MIHTDIAALWRNILNTPPGPRIISSKTLLDRSHGYDRIPQPGFVGKNYNRGGLLIVGLNPAGGGTGTSLGDIEQYGLLARLKVAQDPELLNAFHDLMCALRGFMPSRKIFETNGINELLASHNRSFDDIAYLNACKWRTISGGLKVSVLEEEGKSTLQQIQLLEPSHIIALGQKVWRSWLVNKNLPAETFVISRRIGDSRRAPETAELIEKLKSANLFSF